MGSAITRRPSRRDDRKRSLESQEKERKRLDREYRKREHESHKHDRGRDLDKHEHDSHKCARLSSQGRRHCYDSPCGLKQPHYDLGCQEYHPNYPGFDRCSHASSQQVSTHFVPSFGTRLKCSSSKTESIHQNTSTQIQTPIASLMIPLLQD